MKYRKTKNKHGYNVKITEMENVGSSGGDASSRDADYTTKRHLIKKEKKKETTVYDRWSHRRSMLPPATSKVKNRRAAPPRPFPVSPVPPSVL